MPFLARLCAGALLAALPASAPSQIADLIGSVSRESYQKLKSFSAEGTITTVIDLTKTPAGKAARVRGFNGGELGADSSFMKSQTRETAISIKLRREGEYRVEWRQKIGRKLITEGAVWNAGEGDFIQIPERGMGRAPDRKTALEAATGFSGGASHAIPSLFYGFSPDALTEIQGLTRLTDEPIGDDLCFVLSGNLKGQGVQLWIRKKDYLIIQRKQILGGAAVLPSLTDAEARKAIEASGRLATPKAIEKQKELRETERKTMRTVRGHSTLLLTNIVVNDPIPAAELKPVSDATPGR